MAPPAPPLGLPQAARATRATSLNCVSIVVIHHVSLCVYIHTHIHMTYTYCQHCAWLLALPLPLPRRSDGCQRRGWRLPLAFASQWPAALCKHFASMDAQPDVLSDGHTVDSGLSTICLMSRACDFFDSGTYVKHIMHIKHLFWAVSESWRFRLATLGTG